MRTLMNTIASAALMGPFFLQPAAAGDANGYPRVVGSGENMSVEYGPAPPLNIVGGGHVTATGSGDSVELRYADSANVQQPPAGMVPTVRGNGENQEVVWVPAGDVGLNWAVAKNPATAR
ncbi:hypothetical protein DFH01_23645 [Falsiroseomonas bella]|uniref:Uncharacterized protein n=1 Tax=Falsiroseomonas bella TaxID=2184016 RepID=A0A317F5U6_9PROT|nr:hypothetical protein [Falsiroseomonas bella]PWS34540.1 hypothetical protein DFH01_23645 [Falsiroseomonas bella]